MKKQNSLKRRGGTSELEASEGKGEGDIIQIKEQNTQLQKNPG